MTAWHDAAANVLNIQFDNGKVTSVSYSAGVMDTTRPLSVGAFADGTYLFDGRIDELALYKRVLTSTERTWLYNNGQGASEPRGSDVADAGLRPARRRSYASLGAQLHAVTSAVTNGTCPQGEMCSTGRYHLPNWDTAIWNMETWRTNSKHSIAEKTQWLVPNGNR